MEISYTIPVPTKSDPENPLKTMEACATVEPTMNHHERMVGIVNQWLDERCDRDGQAGMSQQSLWRDFARWCPAPRVPCTTWVQLIMMSGGITIDREQGLKRHAGIVLKPQYRGDSVVIPSRRKKERAT